MVGYLPLAIVQAGSYILQHRIPVADYILLLSLYPRDILDASKPIDPWEERDNSLFATWDISFQAVAARDPLATRILMVCAHLSPHDISLLILEDGMGEPGMSIYALSQLLVFDNSVN